MKNFRNTFLMFFVMLLTALFNSAFAQVYNTAAAATEGATYVRYSGSVDMTADGDSIASHYTQALLLGDANQSIGLVQLYLPNVAGSEDINVYAEFSQDRLNWKAITTPVKDALAAGTTIDTLSTIGGVAIIEFKGSIWLRLRFDGQTGNPRNIVTWSVYLPKNAGAPPRGVAVVENRRT